MKKLLFSVSENGFCLGLSQVTRTVRKSFENGVANTCVISEILRSTGTGLNDRRLTLSKECCH